MIRIRIVVPAVPVAQPRPRAVTGGNRPRMIEADGKHSVHAFKACVAHEAKEVYSGPPLSCPLRMHLVFIMPRPRRLVWKKRPMPREPFVNKSHDWDNLGKSVSDSLNQRIYDDDGRLFDVHVEKWFAAGDEQPHVVIEIETLEDL